MKKIILTITAVFALAFVNAQDKKDKKDGFSFSNGNFYLGGTVSYTSTDNGTVKTSGSSLSPEAGYFISDNFALTAMLSIGNTDNGVGTKTSTFGIGAGGRYYFLNLGERFKTFTNFGLGYNSNDNGGNGADKTSTITVGGGLGINYFVTSKLAIDFSLANILSYSSSKTGDVSTSSLNLDVNTYRNFFATPTFGLIYKLN